MDSPSLADRMVPPAGVKTRLFQSPVGSNDSYSSSPVYIPPPDPQPQFEFKPQNFSTDNVTGLKKKGRVFKQGQYPFTREYFSKNQNSIKQSDLLDHDKEERLSKDRIAFIQNYQNSRSHKTIFDNMKFMQNPPYKLQRDNELRLSNINEQDRLRNNKSIDQLLRSDVLPHINNGNNSIERNRFNFSSQKVLDTRNQLIQNNRR